MDTTENPLWFMGDLTDSWLVSIAGELARCSGIVQVHCPGDLPDLPFAPDRPPRLLVIHRHRFTAVDAQRLKEYRVSAVAGDAPAILLCVSPYVRYEELERWSVLVDLVISDATAADILPGHVARLVERRVGRSTRAGAAGFRIEVASSNHDLCKALVEACGASGYRSVQVADLDVARAAVRQASPSAVAERILTIWDVPLLEPEWSQRLEQRSRSNGPVIALLGFADRETVTIAKACGAIACLELPYNVDDLIDAIDRAAKTLAPDRWPVPVRAEQPHRLPPPPRRRKGRQERPAAAIPWSEFDGKPRVGNDRAT
jgi:CheY-like chemotaxis protein